MSEPKARGAAWTVFIPPDPPQARGASDEGRTRLEGGPEVSECEEGVCITCSDTAVQVRVVRLLADQMAVVDTGAGEETVSVALVTAGVGDTVLVHAKEAIAVVGAGNGPGNEH
jgi:hydrogenase expression/formation protein HypC